MNSVWSDLVLENIFCVNPLLFRFALTLINCSISVESTTVLPLKENCLTLYRKSNFSGNKDKQDVDIPMKIKNTLQKTRSVFRNSQNIYWFKFSLICSKLYQDFLIPSTSETFPPKKLFLEKTRLNRWKSRSSWF